MIVSPTLANLPPQHGQAVGPGITTRSRQMRRKGGAPRLSAGERAYCRALALRRGGFVLGRQLVEQLAAALGRLLAAWRSAAQVCHHRLGAGGARLRFLARRTLGGQRCFQRGDLVGKVLGRARHGPIVAQCQSPAATLLLDESICHRECRPYPATSGRQVRTGLRQSIPSSM